MCEGVDPMGRGRAKAKQTKVARELKYQSYETDFGALARELHGKSDEPEAEAEELEGHPEWSDYSDPSDSDD